MKYSLIPLLMALGLSLAGCGNDSRPEKDKAAELSPAPVAPAPAVPVTQAPPDSLLKTGMPYAEMRQALLAQGWEPVSDSQCKFNVIGGDHQALCTEHPDLRSCQLCSELPELSACSGDAHCLMNFKRGDQALEISTYGDINDWKTLGNDSQLSLSSWKLLPASSR